MYFNLHSTFSMSWQTQRHQERTTKVVILPPRHPPRKSTMFSFISPSINAQESGNIAFQKFLHSQKGTTVFPHNMGTF